jgi:hypothetical protein
MDKSMLVEHLALAERHVAESEGVVRRQQHLIARLERDGHETSMAKELLQEFERSLQFHRDDLQRIREELTSHED